MKYFVEDIKQQLTHCRNTLKDCAFVCPILYKKDEKRLDYNCAIKKVSNWNLLITYLLWYRYLFSDISRCSRKTIILKNVPHVLSKEYVPIELPSGSCMYSSRQLWEKP